MNSEILVINAGSSSIKFSLHPVRDTQQKKLHGEISGLGTRPLFSASGAKQIATAQSLPAQVQCHASALEWLFQWLANGAYATNISGAGHRVVHGGAHYAEPVRIDGNVLANLEELVAMAPLHQPHNLAAIRALAALKPDLPQVACFDTAFHRTQPAIAQAFALPRDITQAGVRRYGFHGLSYEYIAGVLPDYLGTVADGRVVIAHLGNGASLCAMQNRKSIASTMGFTALDGLMMGTRCGALDPGVLLYLLQPQNMPLDALEDLLYRRSGLLGVSGISSDMRELLPSDAPAAREAVALFCYRAARELGSLLAALGGLDALVFTAGIGEYAHQVRKSICEQFAWLGLEIDAQANHAGHSIISTSKSKIRVAVIPTNEEAVIAGHTAQLLEKGR